MGYAGDGRHGLGLDNRHGLYPMCGDEHGRTLLVDADQWRLVLCLCGPGTAGVGSPRGL